VISLAWRFLCVELSVFSRVSTSIQDREACRRDQVAERASLNQFHHHIEVVACLSHLMNSAYVGMTQGRGRLRLAQQMAGGNFVERSMREQLECHIAVQYLIPRAVHDTHTAFANLLKNSVMI
jgi:hypothetical protein